jgi:hypothetical protein
MQHARLLYRHGNQRFCEHRPRPLAVINPRDIWIRFPWTWAAAAGVSAFCREASMIRSLVCMATTIILLGGEIAACAASPQSPLMDYRVAEHRPKRLRRLGNRFGANQPSPTIQLGEGSSPAAASNDPVKLGVRGGWNGSPSTKNDLTDESAAALFPAQAPVSQIE